MAWYADHVDPPITPPDDPPTCLDCRWCVDVGLDDHGVCVERFQHSCKYADMRAVEFGEFACEEFDREPPKRVWRFEERGR